MSRTRNPFPINLDDDSQGLGNLIVTDAALLIRPGSPEQYPYSVKHDSAHAFEVLDLGNDMGEYCWHIITSNSVPDAHDMLDRVFYAYADMSCLELWCDAFVNYVVDEALVRTEEYGFEDGSYSMRFTVHCGVAEDAVDELINSLIDNPDAYRYERFVVARRDSSERGYSAEGIIAGCNIRCGRRGCPDCDPSYFDQRQRVN